MGTSRSANINVWDKLYQQGQSNLFYPDSIFVMISNRMLDITKHSTGLDYGFGTGANLIYLLNRGFDVSGVEISQSAVEITNQKINASGLESTLKLIEKNGEIPFENEKFDFVIAWGVLSYNNWQDLELAISEIDRVLKPGGLFLGTMHAPDDYTHIHSHPLGDGLYQSEADGQSGAIVLIADENNLQRCFPGKSLIVGEMGHKFLDRQGRFWIISYEK
jgi:SAM-dependent methyltransferase